MRKDRTIKPLDQTPSFPGEQRFRLEDSAEGHQHLIAALLELAGLVKVGFEATGGQEWVLSATLVAAGIDAGQLPPAQIKAFALSRGTRAKTDRIDAELIARFMLFRPEAGRRLPSENQRILRALTTRRAQIVDMRKRLLAQIAARRKQSVPVDIEGMDDALKTILDAQFADLERRIERVIAQEEASAAKARLLRSIPGIGPVSAAMLIAEMPELGRITAGEAAAMTGLAQCHMIAGRCEAGDRSPAGDGLCGTFCSRPHSPSPVTIPF